MATPETTTEDKSKSTSELVTKAQSFVSDLENYYKGFAGKPGYNPYVYLSDTLWPLQIALNVSAGAEQIKVANKILGLTKDESLAKVIVMTTPTPTEGVRKPVTTINQTIVK